MKKYSLYIITIPIVIIFFVLILCLLRKNENVKTIGENKNSEPEQAVLVEEAMLDKYGGEVIQVGGVGSRIHQITAYRIWEDMGYLNPAEDWIGVSFNNPADIMDVNCNKDGYKIYLCKFNDKDGIIMDGNCRVELEERIKNRVVIACAKDGANDKPNKDKTIADSLKENPSFNDVIAGGCEEGNIYLGKKVQWKAMVSGYAHTGGIRFIVLDEDHLIESYKSHGLFYGTFLVSAGYPGDTEEGLKKWYDKWKLSYVAYILDVYGNIQDKDRNADSVFLVTAYVDYVDCDKSYDGGYIETSVEKVEIIKK